jgi:hypothetical protein
LTPFTLHDRVYRPGRDLDPEQLPRELGRVATRDAVTYRERDDRRLQPRPERDALVEDLVATLDGFSVPKAEQDELLGPMRDQIVEVESPDTGTPLPDSYEAAPGLA